MKKLLGLATAFSMAFIVAGCGSKSESEKTTAEKTNVDDNSPITGTAGRNPEGQNQASLNQGGRGTTPRVRSNGRPNNDSNNRGVVQASGSTPARQPGAAGGDLNTPVPNVTWLTSFRGALAESEKSGKPVLIDFTGKKMVRVLHQIAKGSV